MDTVCSVIRQHFTDYVTLYYIFYIIKQRLTQHELYDFIFQKSLCLPKVSVAAATPDSRCLSHQAEAKLASDPFSLVETELAVVTKNIKQVKLRVHLFDKRNK